MAFAPKTDFAGLVAATTVSSVEKLTIRNHELGGTNEKYQPDAANGDFAGTDVFGEDYSPTNSYGLKANLSVAAGAIKLNKVTTVTEGSGQSAVTRKFGLESVKISTKIGSPVEISTTSKELEATADDANQDFYWLPAFALTTKQVAQDIFSAFTVGGEGCHLQDVSVEAACKINRDDVAGVKISSDCLEGVITVSGNILSTSGNVPTVTPLATAVDLGNSMTSNWVLTKPPKITESNPEKEAKKYGFELQLTLKKYHPTNGIQPV